MKILTSNSFDNEVSWVAIVYFKNRNLGFSSFTCLTPGVDYARKFVNEIVIPCQFEGIYYDIEKDFNITLIPKNMINYDDFVEGDI